MGTSTRETYEKLVSDTPSPQRTAFAGGPSTSPVGSPGGTAATGEAFLAAYYGACRPTGKFGQFLFQAVMTLQYDDENRGQRPRVRGCPIVAHRSGDRATARRGGQEERGSAAIYGGRRARVTSMDCQVSSKGTMLLVASGTLEHNPSVGEGDSTYGVAPFVQSFVEVAGRRRRRKGASSRSPTTHCEVRATHRPVSSAGGQYQRPRDEREGLARRLRRRPHRSP